MLSAAWSGAMRAPKAGAAMLCAASLFALAGCGESAQDGDPSAEAALAPEPPPPPAAAERPPKPDPLSRQPAREDRVSRAVASAWTGAAQADVLGIRLGMAPGMVRERLEAHGFALGDADWVGFDGYDGSYLQQARFTKGGLAEGAGEVVKAYFTPSAKPQLQALFRETSYYGDKEVAYDRMLATIAEKYGAAGKREKNNIGDIEWLTWPSAGAGACEQTRSGLWRLERGTPTFDMAGCMRGLVMTLHFDDDEAARPVGLVQTYLVDSEAARIGRETITAFVAAKEQREREQALQQARPTEL